VYVRIGHGFARILLCATCSPAHHFRNQVFESCGRHSVVGFVDERVGIQSDLRAAAARPGAPGFGYLPQ
jgi:hypothetical protein